MPKVSVILTSYNRPKLLKVAIDSVLKQTMEDWELVVVDDNSPDTAVWELLDEYVKLDPRIKAYNSNVAESMRYKRAGYAANINSAMYGSAASGSYIAYLVDDDYYYPQKLEVMSEYLDNNPGVIVCFSAQHIIDVDGHVRGVRHFNEPLTKAWDALDHSSVMHRREVFFDAGGWPDGAGNWGGADAWFFKRINDLGIKFYPVGPVPLEVKRYHEDAVQWKIANNCFGNS